uniref:Uncharacterized protein n=1 Tax=Zea mays TaxID=4577 RepID=B6TPT3_MAIZE|nr:hypothetical protein [Zea mays]
MAPGLLPLTPCRAPQSSSSWLQLLPWTADLPFLQQASVPLSIIFSAWFLASSPCSSARPGPVPFFHSCGKHQSLPTPTSLSYGRCPSLVSGGRPPLLLPW